VRAIGNRRNAGRFFIALVAGACSVTAFGQAEFRAMWISRFEWPSATPSVAQSNLDNAMQDLADNHFNAAVLQVRGQADTLYPSPYEVWSPLIGGTDPGWDPLAYAVNAAHSRGIELHAYINTHTCWQSGSATPPANPSHLFYQHCNAANPAARDWLHHDNPTNPVQFSESDYVWIAPGAPAFQAYIRQQILHVVENYDVDGIHYDRIRTPWSNQPSFDPISLARFNDPQSNPDGLDFTAWTADQITRNVRDIYAAIMAEKPWIKVSAAVFNNPTTAPTAQHQDGLAWANTGGLDICVPMIYFSGGQNSTWDTRLQLWLNGTSRHVVAGQITSVGSSMLIDQINVTRLRGGEGNNVFSWTSFTGWGQYTAQVYQQPVATPAISWKDNPTTGIILGRVIDGGGAAVVDTQITRNGSAYTALSTGDGFYSFLLVPPGTYTLTASHPAHSPQNVANVVVAAGQVTEVDIQFGAVLPPVIADVAPDPATAVVDQEYTVQLSLAQGTADDWDLVSGPPGASVDGSGFVSGWTPSPADDGQMFDFVVEASNTAGSDQESWTVQVSATAPCDKFDLADFDAYAAGQSVLFNLPRFSGSTSNDLALSPNVAEVDAAAAPFSPPNAMRVEWQYVDTDPQRWMRLTTFNGAQIPNPTIPLDRPLRVRLRLDGGALLVSLGIRETGASAELGEDGGTGGTIEWVGADSDVNGAPQGKLLEGAAGVWQTLIFDPLSDPIHGFTGDGNLVTATGLGVLEHLGFAVLDSPGPFTLHIDDIDVLCGLPDYGDFNGDADILFADYEFFNDCMQGPDVSVAGDCLAADDNLDTDVDMGDFVEFQRVFGPAR